jgi:hypothetical protein
MALLHMGLFGWTSFLDFISDEFYCSRSFLVIGSVDSSFMDLVLTPDVSCFLAFFVFLIYIYIYGVLQLIFCVAYSIEMLLFVIWFYQK